MSIFIPNETKRFVPRDPPWINKPVKTMRNRKNRLFKNYKRHGYRVEDKVRLDTFRSECQQAVETAKLSYLTALGNKVNDPNTSQKTYWKIINRVMNKCRAPKVPPLLVNNLFILNCKEKARHFNDFFSHQFFFFLFFMHLCPGTMVTHAESINSDLQRGLDRHLQHTQHWTQNRTS